MKEKNAIVAKQHVFQPQFWIRKPYNLLRFVQGNIHSC